ncbi:MAG TPA: hypothetical protein VEL51_21810 [Vicinamibacterales bacterium]|nr:hypothetical protein [Vicinamibacterales bacterium]
MTFLLRLYPSAWRRRYGGEVREMLAGRRFSLRIAVDLIAGAIDTWLHPSVTLAAAAAAARPTPEEQTMLSRLLRFDCAGLYGPGVTRADQWKASISVVVMTVVLTIAWWGLHLRLHDDPRMDSLSLMPFVFALFYSMRYTYLKGRPAIVQAVFIGGLTLLVAAVVLAVGWATTTL